MYPAAGTVNAYQVESENEFERKCCSYYELTVTYSKQIQSDANWSVVVFIVSPQFPDSLVTHQGALCAGVWHQHLLGDHTEEHHQSDIF